MIVEDGSVVDGATSYVDVAYFEEYWLSRNADFSTYSDSEFKAALIIATQYVDNNYFFKGLPTSESQPLQWPRAGASDKNGNLIPSDEIPAQVKNAVCEFAKRQLSGDIQGDPSTKGIIESESSKVGTLSQSVTYVKGSQYSGSANIPAADAWLSGVITGGRLGRMGRLVR